MESDLASCPRCNAPFGTEEYYGICTTCAGQLRATFDGQPRSDVSSAEYEPKMNVTPNAVASKE